MSHAAPFYGFRLSSSTSVDVKMEKDSDVWNGLVSVCGVSIDELLRQAKTAYAENQWKAVFLAELPRMLTWGGCTEPHTDEKDGSISFKPGQVIEVELEDPNSGEIDDKKITCTVEKYESMKEQTEELIDKLNEEDGEEAAGSAPKVGLDAMFGGGGAHHHDPHHHGHEDEDDDYEDMEDEEEDEEAEEDLKNGLGKDLAPNKSAKDKAIKDQLKSICTLGNILGLPNSEMREAFLAAGGVIPEDPAAHLFDDEDEHGVEDMMGGGAGGPGGAGGCKQQ